MQFNILYPEGVHFFSAADMEHRCLRDKFDMSPLSRFIGDMMCFLQSLHPNGIESGVLL